MPNWIMGETRWLCLQIVLEVISMAVRCNCTKLKFCRHLMTSCLLPRLSPSHLLQGNSCVFFSLFPLITKSFKSKAGEAYDIHEFVPVLSQHRKAFLLSSCFLSFFFLFSCSFFFFPFNFTTFVVYDDFNEMKNMILYEFV